MEHPLPRTRGLCPSRALHGAHRALVVYITHMVLPHQGQASPWRAGKPGLGWFCLDQLCPVPCLGVMVSVHYTVSVPAPRT